MNVMYMYLSVSTCNAKRCICCKYLHCKSTIISSFNDADLDWHIIYVQTCSEKCRAMQYVGQTKRTLKARLREHFGEWKSLRKLIRFFADISGELVLHDHLTKCWFSLLKDLINILIHLEDLYCILRHEIEKWIKLLQTHFPLGFNDNIFDERKISKISDVDVFSLSNIRKGKRRSHC